MRDIEELIAEIHENTHQTVIAIAGGGSLAVAWLLSVPGASKTILESVVPYGRLSMVNLLGFEPDQYVSPETAQAMAKACYQRALKLRESNLPVLGVACTATLVTDRIKRGDHRCSLSIWSANQVINCDLILDKGKRDRRGEEKLVSRLLLQLLSQGMDIESKLEIGFSDMESPEFEILNHGSPVARLLSGEVNTVLVDEDGTMSVDELVASPILPGSFSPLHSGHEGLAKVAAGELGAPVVFDISVQNVDKPPLGEEEIYARLAQFAGKFKVVLTRAETFQKKSRLFKEIPFVIGWDTAVRLIDPRYYSNDHSTMCMALAELCANGSRFLVAGRTNSSGFKTLDDVMIPEGFGFLFSPIPEALFRLDVSSTELRAYNVDP